MRPILLAMLCLVAAAAEREAITLKDGRTFTGVYDADEQVLHTSTAAGRAFDLKVPTDQIADRQRAKEEAPRAAAAPAKDAASLAPMTPEAKASAQRDFAYQQKLREAESLDADAAKIKRDADAAHKLSAKQLEHARNDWRAFCKRASDEGVYLSPEGPISEELIVLPRTKGNNRGSMEGLAQSKETAAKVPELEHSAQAKAQAATAARAAAEQLPHSDRATAPSAAAAAPAPSPSADAAAAPAKPSADLADTVAALDQADIAEDRRHAAARAELEARRKDQMMAWLSKADLHDAELPTLSADPKESEAKEYRMRKEMNGVLAALRLMHESHPDMFPHDALVDLAKNYWPTFVATR